MENAGGWYEWLGEAWRALLVWPALTNFLVSYGRTASLGMAFVEMVLASAFVNRNRKGE